VTGSKTARQQAHSWSGTGRRRRPSCGPLLFTNEWHRYCCWLLLLMGPRGWGTRRPRRYTIQLTWCLSVTSHFHAYKHIVGNYSDHTAWFVRITQIRLWSPE